MDWQISPLSRESSWNQRPFEPGDHVTTLLLLGAVGEVSRYDLHSEDLEEAWPQIADDELGRWTRRIRPKAAEGESKAERLHSAEELFFSLYGETLASEQPEEDAVMPETSEPEVEKTSIPEVKAALQHILALQLERKRLLRAVGKRRIEGDQEYLHVKTHKSFLVPVLPVDDALFQRLTFILSDLVL